MTDNKNNCEHQWEYQGTVYWNAEFPRPGSGAYDRIYGDRFFCNRCLAIRIINERKHGTSYDQPIEGTLPK